MIINTYLNIKSRFIRITAPTTGEMQSSIKSRTVATPHNQPLHSLTTKKCTQATFSDQQQHHYTSTRLTSQLALLRKNKDITTNCILGRKKKDFSLGLRCDVKVFWRESWRYMSL